MHKRLLTTTFMGMFAAACVHAQLATTTSLVGTVTDATGKVVPNANVSAVNTGTHDVYSGVTNEQGFYNLQFVAIGDYDLTVEQPGFQAFKITGIHVDINQVVRNDVVLRVGSVVESVTVQAPPPPSRPTMPPSQRSSPPATLRSCL
jgi:hypothetical protein